MTIDGTNTWIIPGPRGAVVVDPGPADPRHLAAVGGHGPIAAVLLTHRHADHSAALGRLSERIPVHAASGRFARVVDPVRDGQRIEAGGIALRVLRTPGHTADSVCFAYDDAARGPILFTGDTLLGGRRASALSTLDGALDAYLASLAMLASPRLWEGYRGMPGHGPAIADIVVHARSALEHRRSRLRALRAHLAAGGSRDPEVIALTRHPDRPERRKSAAAMIEQELRYLALPAG
jgi:glyoxylase-like metal-dependent hydrolase (beta-lactamase superfamily II)